MNSEIAPRDDSPDLVMADIGQIDLLDDDALFRRTESAVAAQGGRYTEAIAARLDSLLAVRLVRLLRSTTTTEAHLESLDTLIVGVGREKFRATLEGLSRPYFARWCALRDLASTAIAAIRWERSQSERAAPSVARSDWELVATLVLKAGDEGLPWSELADTIIEKTGRRSRGGVSQLLTSLRAARWVEVLPEPHSQRKRVHPGARIAESRAWKELRGSDVGGPSAGRPATIESGADPEGVAEVLRVLADKVAQFQQAGGAAARPRSGEPTIKPGADAPRPGRMPPRDGTVARERMMLH